MKPFLSEKRRLIDLGVLVVLNSLIFIFTDSWASLCLFSFGFIWNWTAAQDLSALLSNPRYKYSMVRFVSNIQNLIQKPFVTYSKFLNFLVRLLPAGIFWGMVIVINESNMPWWMTFAGSLAFEILQIDIKVMKKEKESVS